MHGSNEVLKWNVKNQNTWHVMRTLKIGLYGQNHAILSSVRVSGTQSNLLHNSTLYFRKKHSTEFHTFNKEQGKYIKAQNCTSYRPFFFNFVYFQVVLILLNDSITVVVSLMQDAQCCTLPHNCKRCHCTDIKMWLHLMAKYKHIVKWLESLR